MKKIFTLTLGLLLTVAIFAADRRPTITVNASRKYEIVIDGKHYLGNYNNSIRISDVFNGRRIIKVYEMRPGFFLKSKKLVASSSFQLRNSDIMINVDRLGQMQIFESKGRDWNDHDRFDNNHDFGHDRNRNSRF